MSFRRNFFRKLKDKEKDKDKEAKEPEKDAPPRNNTVDLHELQSNLEISKFLLACEQGDISTLRSILIQYDDVHDEQAASQNHSKLQLLLNHQDLSTNKTGLIYACVGGHTHIVDELIKRGADIEKCHDGSTPLYHATSRGHIDIVQMLLSYRANVDAVNGKGWTALMNASYFGHTNIVKLLLQYRADPDIIRQQFDGKTALHFAAKNGRYRVVELLLDYGANPNIADYHEATTPLMYAAQHGYQQIMQLLILYGADPLIANSNGCKAIDFIDYKPSSDDMHVDSKPRQQTSDSEDELDDEEQGSNVNTEEQHVKMRQKSLYLLLSQSQSIHRSICKLIDPKQMRLILRNMNNVHNTYPVLKHRIQRIRHISDLYDIAQNDMKQFTVLCTNDIKRNLMNLKPQHGNVENDIDVDDDGACGLKLILAKHIDVNSVVLVHDYVGMNRPYPFLEKYYDKVDLVHGLAVLKVKSDIDFEELQADFDHWRYDAER